MLLMWCHPSVCKQQNWHHVSGQNIHSSGARSHVHVSSHKYGKFVYRTSPLTTGFRFSVQQSRCTGKEKGRDINITTHWSLKNEQSNSAATQHVAVKEVGASGMLPHLITKKASWEHRGSIIWNWKRTQVIIRIKVTTRKQQQASILQDQTGCHHRDNSLTFSSCDVQQRDDYASLSRNGPSFSLSSALCLPWEHFSKEPGLSLRPRCCSSKSLRFRASMVALQTATAESREWWWLVR